MKSIFIFLQIIKIYFKLWIKESYQKQWELEMRRLASSSFLCSKRYNLFINLKVIIYFKDNNFWLSPDYNENDGEQYTLNRKLRFLPLNENALIFQASELDCNWNFNYISFIQKVLSTIYFGWYFCRPFFNDHSLLNIFYHLFYKILIVMFLDICNYQNRESNN